MIHKGQPMHGFKPKKAHAAAAQNFADGGMVGRIKGALGFKPADPEREKRLADYRAEKERAKQGAQPQAAAAPQKAITDYASGGALQRRMKEVDGYKDGGAVLDKVANWGRDVGEYWSQDNAKFEAKSPGLGARLLRSANPMTSLGAAAGAMHDAAAAGSVPGMALAASQAFPAFAAMRAVPAVKSVTPSLAAPAVAPSVVGTAASAGGNIAYGAAADYVEPQVKGFANGGMVRGKGTGTSDEVPAVVPEGTYIMPADSTKALGAKGLASMGAPGVPVNLSNGEFKLPPEQVHAVGVQALDQMKGATHTPVQPQQATAPGQPPEPELFFANGGVVEDEENAKRFAKVPEQFGRRGNSFGDAAAAAADPSVAQVKTVVPAAPAPAMSAAAPAVASPNQTSPSNAYPQSSPSAGANVYGGAGMALGTSGLLATGAERVIAAQPPRPQAPVVQPRPAPPTGAQIDGMVNQIPRDAGPAPAAASVAAPRQGAGPAPAAAAPASASGFYMQDRAQEMQGQWGQGQYAQAIGTAARTAAQGAGMYALEAGEKIASPWVDAAKGFGRGVFGLDGAPATQPAAPGAAPAAAPGQKPAAPVPGQPPAAAAAVVQPPAAAAAPVAPAQTMPGVYNHGRGQYSDSAAGMGMPAGFTGQPSAQNMAAAQALSDRSERESMGRIMAQQRQAQMVPGGGPVEAGSFTGGYSGVIGGGSGNMRSRTPEQQRRDAAVSASSIDPRTSARGAAALKSLDAMDLQSSQSDSAMEQARLREDGANNRAFMQDQSALARTQLQESGANQREGGRNALAQQQMSMAQQAQGFQNRLAAQSEQLRNTLLDPAATPEQRKIAQRSLSILSGKTAADRMQTVNLPDTLSDTGAPVRGGQALVRTLEDGTVEQVPIGGQQQPALPPGMKRQVGTSNGRPVYEDANGKQVIGKA